LLLSSVSYGKEIDIWSLGCLLGELYLERPIFQGTSSLNQLEKIMEVTGAPDLDAMAEIIESETSMTVLKSLVDKI
jgi:serine/threonine protein kinase